MDAAYDIGITYPCGCEVWLFPPRADVSVYEVVSCVFMDLNPSFREE